MAKVNNVHDADTITLEGDTSSSRVYSASSAELGTEEGKVQTKEAQVVMDLPVEKEFISKDFANRDVSINRIQTPKGEVNYSTLAKVMGWTADDSSFYGKGTEQDKTDSKAFWTGDESFDQAEPEGINNAEIVRAEKLINSYRDQESVYKAGGMSKEQYLEVLGDTMTGENHDTIIKYLTYKNQTGKYISENPEVREQKRMSNLMRSGHTRVNPKDEHWSDTLRGMGKILYGDLAGDNTSNIEAVNQDLNPTYNVNLEAAKREASKDKTKMNLNWSEMTSSLSQEDKEKVELAKYESDGYALMVYRDIKNFNDRQSKMKEVDTVTGLGLMTVGAVLNPANLALGGVTGVGAKSVGIAGKIALNKLGIPLVTAKSHGLLRVGTGILGGAMHGAAFMTGAGALEFAQDHQTPENLKEEAEMGAMLGAGFHVLGMGVRAGFNKLVTEPKLKKEIELNRLQDVAKQKAADEAQTKLDIAELQQKRLEMETELAKQAKLKKDIKQRRNGYHKVEYMTESEAREVYDYEVNQDYELNAQDGPAGTEVVEGRFPAFEEWMNNSHIKLGVGKSSFKEWNQQILGNESVVMSTPFSLPEPSTNPNILMKELQVITDKLVADPLLKQNNMFMHNLEVAKGKLNKSLGRTEAGEVVPDGALAEKLGVKTNAEAVEILVENPELGDIGNKTIGEASKPDKVEYVEPTIELINEGKALTAMGDKASEAGKIKAWKEEFEPEKEDTVKAGDGMISRDAKPIEEAVSTVQVETATSPVPVEVPKEHEVSLDLAEVSDVVTEAEAVGKNAETLISKIEEAFDKPNYGAEGEILANGQIGGKPRGRRGADGKRPTVEPEKPKYDEYTESELIYEAEVAYDKTPAGKTGEDMPEDFISTWINSEAGQQKATEILFENRPEDEVLPHSESEIEVQNKLMSDENKKLTEEKDRTRKLSNEAREEYEVLKEAAESPDDMIEVQNALAKYHSAQTIAKKAQNDHFQATRTSAPQTGHIRTKLEESQKLLKDLDLPEGFYDMLDDHMGVFTPAGAGKRIASIMKTPGMENVVLGTAEISSSNLVPKSVRIIVKLGEGDNPREIKIKQAAAEVAKEELPKLQEKLDSMTEEQIKRDCP